MKRVLITGADSYIGNSVRDYLLEMQDQYAVDVMDTIGWNPEANDFAGYDVVFNVAGIAHVKENNKNRHLYYEINRDLVVRIAQAAKAGGVTHFVLLSSMSVYGLLEGHITKSTLPKPVNAYGKSKAEADEEIFKLEDDSFIVSCLRPPMVYGKGCKGNYQSLRRFALKSPLFPDCSNERSMIYIGNLCEFVKSIIDERKGGVFFPQNSEYVNTSEMVKVIASENAKKIAFTKIFNPFIRKAPLGIVKKVFGNLTYEKVDMVYKYSFNESISITEG